MSTDSLGWPEAVAALRALEGRELSVRIALRHRNEDLLAVFHGRLGALSQTAKQPSLFWPLAEAGDHLEQPGIYLREGDFVSAERRAGDILVIEQAEVVVNLRPLERD
jgi:hypothetical protein